jgi:hypothetical protein
MGWTAVAEDPHTADRLATLHFSQTLLWAGLGWRRKEVYAVRCRKLTIRKIMASKSSTTQSRCWRLRKRFLLVTAAIVLVLGLVGAGGFYVFQGWRARDLAGKALESLEIPNYRMAWIQLNSARSLRPDDTQVLRTAAIIESRFGMPSAVESWKRLEQSTNLTVAELQEMARISARFGSKEQFDGAVLALEKSGLLVEAGQLRAARHLHRGNIEAALEETGRTAEALNDGALRLDHIRLLLRRHMDRLARPEDPQTVAIANEISEIIDSLAGSPQEQDALALGLAFLQSPGGKRRGEWTEQALQDLRPGNPALLAAASVAVQTGRSDPPELYRQMRPVFDAAPLERRSAFSLWLTRHRMPAEALTLITAQEAMESSEAFTARVEALATMENWSAITETSNAQGKVPEFLRLAARARAEFALGYGQSAATTAADAVRAAARAGNLPPLVESMDSLGAGASVDIVLLELCEQSRYADTAFRIARERFTRREPAGGPLLTAAVERVASSAPESPAYLDYRRYKLLVAELVRDDTEGATENASAPSPEETAKAVDLTPGDPSVRVTHGLALLRAGRAEEAREVFDDFTVYFNRLPPPLQAGVAAILAAGGEPKLGAEMSQRIKADVLTTQERLLLSGAAEH